MSKQYRLCCLTKNKTNPAYLGAQIGAARRARRLGHELVGYAPDIPDDVTSKLHC
jgi:ribose transport system substrate-binding protein